MSCWRRFSLSLPVASWPELTQRILPVDAGLDYFANLYFVSRTANDTFSNFSF